MRARVPLAIAALGLLAGLASVSLASPASAAGAPKLERMLGWVERNNDLDDEFRADFIIRVPTGERPSQIRYDWDLNGTLDSTASLATGPGQGQQYQIVSSTQVGDEDLLAITVRGDGNYDASCTNQPQVLNNWVQVTVPSGVINIQGFTTTVYSWDGCTQPTTRPLVRLPWDNAWGSPAGTSQGGWGAIINGTLGANLAIIDADNPNNGGRAANCGITDSVSYQWYKETAPGTFSPSGTMTTTAVTPHHGSSSGALFLPAKTFPSDGYYKLLAWPNAKSSAGGADCSTRTYTPGNTAEAFVVGSVFNNFVSTFTEVQVTGSLPDGTVGDPYASPAPTATGGTGPYAWSTTSPLPSGLTLDPATGVISGTPAPGSEGTYPVTVTVTDADGNQASFIDAITIAGVPPVEIVANGSFPTGNEQLAGYASPAPTATGGTGPYTWSTDSPLPSGLTLDPATGVISGTPADGTKGTYPVTLTATDANGDEGSFTDELNIFDEDGLPMVDPRVGALAAGLGLLAVAGFELRRRRTAGLA